MKDLVIAYDLGGTKVAVAAVSTAGDISDYKVEPVRFAEGPDAVVAQLVALGLELKKKYPEITHGAVAAAGPLDPVRGVFLDPTNFISKGGASWGEFDLIGPLANSLNVDLRLENDAAAAILAEHWKGQAAGVENCMILTLGTGVGVGTVANGRLVRSGRCLHPEASHIKLNLFDETAPCGCGHYGCIEAYLSGRNFTRRVAKKLGENELTGQELVRRARNGEESLLKAFSEYAFMMAHAIACYVPLYSPEVIVFSGGFSHASELFLPETQTIMEKLLVRRRVGVDLLPELRISKFKDEAGILGAASLAHSRRQ